MTAPSAAVQASLANLRERWGGAAPRWGGEVVGALAIDPRSQPRVEFGAAEALGTDAAFPARRPDDSLGERALPTGFGSLDAILGLGGLPRAATTALHGDGTSGKTTLALTAAARAQAAGGLVAYLDLARSLDPVEAVARGVRLEWLVVLTPDSLDQAVAMAAMLLQDRTVDLLLLDLPSRPMNGTRISVANLAERLARLTAMARRAGVQVLVLEPPRLPTALSGALSQVAALRLDLSRREWIRMGRDVVGQRTEVRVARDRFGPPGRSTELRIMYADGGLRDACLVREELLSEGGARVRRLLEPIESAPRILAGTGPPGPSGVGSSPGGVRPLAFPIPPGQVPTSGDATSPPSLASPAPPPGPRPRLRILEGTADRPGRQALAGRSGPGRERAGARTGRPTLDAARGGP